MMLAIKHDELAQLRVHPVCEGSTSSCARQQGALVVFVLSKLFTRISRRTADVDVNMQSKAYSVLFASTIALARSRSR